MAIRSTALFYDGMPRLNGGVSVRLLAVSVLAFVSSPVVGHRAGLEPRPSPPAPCDSLPTPDDTIEYPVSVTLLAPMTPRYGANHELTQDTLNTAFIGRILDAISKNFVRPQHIASNVYNVWRPTIASPVVFGQVMFALTPSGGLARAETSQSSLSPELDQSLIDALHRADSAHSLPAPSEAGSSAPPWLFLTLTSSTHPIGYGFKPMGYGVQLFTQRVPSWRQSSVPVQDPHYPVPKINYPPQSVRQGFEGAVYVEFVIDERGRPIPSTFRFMPGAKFERPPDAVVADSSPDVHLSAFQSVVAEALPNIRFVPGTIVGCAVRQLEIQPFGFSLRRR